MIAWFEQAALFGFPIWAEILFALLLEILIGKPRFLPHLRDGMGALSRFFGKQLQKREQARQAGMLYSILLGILCAFGAWGIPMLLNRWSLLAASILRIALIYSLLNLRTPITTALAVRKSLAASNKEGARARIAQMTRRDTESLSESGLCRVASEELALALCYGFALPLFYLGLGSLVSMPGYGTLGIPLAFGAVALVECGRHITPDGASIDPVGDLPRRIASYALFLPGRAVSALALLSGWILRLNWRSGATVLLLQNPLSRTNPASWTQACFSGLLGIRLGGGAYYGGLWRPSPSIGLDYATPGQKTAQLALRITLLTAPIAAALFLFSPLTSCILGLLIGFTGRAAGSQPL